MRGLICLLNQLKITNIRNTLTKLLSKEQATKMDLVMDTGLSNTTVSDCINNMLKMGIVKVTGRESSMGGRRSSIYGINNDYGCFLGIVIEKNFIDITVTDATNNILESRKFNIQNDKPIIISFLDAIYKIVSDYKNKNILSIGIGLNGVLDYEKQIVINSPELNWQNVHLKEIVERRFFIPTYIEHKINGAAFFEKILGNAKGIENFIFLLEESEGKAAIFLDGKICRGEGNMTGRFLDSKIILQNIGSIADFLDITTIVVGYKSSCYKDIIDSQKQYEKEKGGKKIITFKTEGTELGRGLALIAETSWFESIYFIM